MGKIQHLQIRSPAGNENRGWDFQASRAGLAGDQQQRTLGRASEPASSPAHGHPLCLQKALLGAHLLYSPGMQPGT